MAGIQHLSEIYTKKGKDFLDNLFSGDLVVTEKADGSSFLFQKSSDDDSGINFFKRDDRKPINKLDRTLMRFYEKPIEYITQFSSDKFPEDFRFGFEYFQNTKPVSIAYDRLPKNNLILTHIKKVDKNGKLVSIIDDIKILNKWADFFNVESPYIIFEGKVNDKQKEEIFNFLSTPFEDLVRRFETQSFTKFIISILNPKLKNTALSFGIDKPVEGLVFKFKKDEFLSKLVDPLFTNAAKIKAKERIERSDNNDQYAIIISSFISWIESNDLINSIKVEGNDEEDFYIDLVTKLTVYYINDNLRFLSGVEIEVPEFAKQDDFKLNTNMIKNKDIVKFIKANENYEPFFRMFLSGFKQLRIKKTNLIDDALKSKINKIVNLLNIRVKTEKPTVNESFLSFNEWIVKKNK